MATKISWCDETINPVVGCSKISAGCDNCFAEGMARRLSAMGLGQYQSVTSFGRWNGLTAFIPSELEKPYRWKTPRAIFISSMGDLFHDSVPFEWIDAVMVMIGRARQHTFIMLTKRPERMRAYFVDRFAAGFTPREGFTAKPLPNLVLGVSIEDQGAADGRLPILRKIPAAKIFVSLEPMIGPVKLGLTCTRCGHLTDAECPGSDYACRMIRPLDGVILGGESGSKGRRLDPQWVSSIRDQCKYAGVPFMFKQYDHSNASTPRAVNPGQEATGFHSWTAVPTQIWLGT